MRFSDYFNLDKKQWELDFVDIPLHTDIPLFLDPYAISKFDDEFSIECNNIIVNFFQTVIDDIKSGNTTSAKDNLSKLKEPNETHFGLSSSKPQGKGVSGKQSRDIFEALVESKAVRSGLLKDLEDCELLIPGISSDKVSDITTNIIKKKLIEYTENQCFTYNIPTARVSSGICWNPDQNRWDSFYCTLPVYQGRKILLIPKSLARHKLEYDYIKYYNGFVLEFLQAEHLNANSGLVQLLKNGVRKVYKKDIKKDPSVKLSKEFLYKFSLEHPEVLERYTSSQRQKIPSLTNEEIEEKHEDPQQPDFDGLIRTLKSIQPGTEHADLFHRHVIGILSSIFSPNLICPIKEEKIQDGRKRIDITYINKSESGFFRTMPNHVRCFQVICECKNYTNDPGNPEVDQISGRFAPPRGTLGFLICRHVTDKTTLINRCRDTAKDGRGYVIAFDDADLIKLLELKSSNQIEQINTFLYEKYKELVN